MIKYDSPLIDDTQTTQLRGKLPFGFLSSTIPMLFKPNNKKVHGEDLEIALEELFRKADEAIIEGVNILILSDRDLNPEFAAIPALLACSGLHHHLIRNGTRTKVSIVVESGEPREVQHFALLIGFGADLVNPYLALQTVRYMISTGDMQGDSKIACNHFLKANLNGVIKTMSKMGISTVASYRGAQIFESIGLNQLFIDKYFTKTATRIEGIGIDAIAAEARHRHSFAFAPRPDERYFL